MKHFMSDQDGTLIIEGPYSVIAEHYKFIDENTHVVQAFQQGNATYGEAIVFFAQQLAIRNVTKQDITNLVKKLTTASGLDNLLAYLDGGDNGLAVISGGLLEVSDAHGITPHFKEMRGARLLYDDEGKITGIQHVEGTSQGKLECFTDICTRHGIPPRDVVYTGDSGNDHAVAKRILQEGGTFLFVDLRESEGTVEHYYKRGEQPEIEYLKQNATAIIHTLDEVIPYLG